MRTLPLIEEAYDLQKMYQPKNSVINQKVLSKGKTLLHEINAVYQLKKMKLFLK